MASLSQLEPLPHSVIEVEALAAQCGVELALELGFHNIELEGDSTGLIISLKDGHRSLAQFGHIVTDIHYLASQFSIFNLSYVCRHCNKVAHSLARRALISPLPLPCQFGWKMHLQMSLMFYMLILAHYLNKRFVWILEKINIIK